MPNWCANSLEIYAPSKHKLTMVCKKLGLKNEIPQLNFCSIVPEPRDLMEQEDGQAGAMPGWYGWRISNWGCKWDVGDIDESYIHYRVVDYDVVENTKPYHSVTISFQTPWSPPVPFVKSLSEKYPDLIVFLEFEEGGVGYEGELLMKDGVVEHEAERDMKPDFEYMIGELMVEEK